MKNTLDYFLEEYYFKPSAIVSYSVGGFGGVNAVQHPRVIFAELGAPSISSSFSISKVQDVFDDAGRLRNPLYDKRVKRFIEEFEWYIDAFKNQRSERHSLLKRENFSISRLQQKNILHKVLKILIIYLKNTKVKSGI